MTEPENEDTSDERGIQEKTDPKLAELPIIEKEYSENINKQMRVPQSIRLTDSFQDPYFDSSFDQSLHEEYEKHQIGNSMKIPRRISYGNRKVAAGDNYFSAGTEHFNPWPIIQSRGDAVQIQTPPRTLRVNGLSTNEYNDLKNAERRSKTTHDLQSLTSKYPQYREADTFNPLRQYDFDEEQLLADLDATSEVEKLRQQNFKLNRRITKLEKERSDERLQHFTVSLLLLSISLGYTYLKTRDL